MEKVYEKVKLVEKVYLENEWEVDTKRKWNLWKKKWDVEKDDERKDVPHQKSHHERCECDVLRDHSNDNPYAQDYNPEKHTQLTEGSALCAHEVLEGHSRHNQKTRR